MIANTKIDDAIVGSESPMPSLVPDAGVLVDRLNKELDVTKRLAHGLVFPALTIPVRLENFLQNPKYKPLVCPSYDSDFLKTAIEKDAGTEVLKFITDQVDLSKTNSILLSLREKYFNDNNNSQQIRTIVNLNPVNYHTNLNAYLKSINSLLPDAGIYIGCYDDYSARKQRIYDRFPKGFKLIAWYTDFLIHRVMPRLTITRGIYEFLMKGKNRALSKAEMLGRLCYSGFEIITNERIDENKYLSFFSVMKSGEPEKDKATSYGPIFKMNRVAKNGKIVKVYKVRTMHPYSEYLQHYVVKMYGYTPEGKPKNDFRVTGWSRFLRKFYLDELPQLFNVVKGDLSIVGVRPLSRFGFSQLPEDLQKDRIKYKPGCVPPNVALGLKGFGGVIRAERIYLRKMKKHPFRTNVQFFFMAMLNIIKRRGTSA